MVDFSVSALSLVTFSDVLSQRARKAFFAIRSI